MAKWLYFNGNIITVNNDAPFAEAVLINDSIIEAVGRLEDVEENADGETIRIDLEGKTMVPGFIDSHSHMMFCRIFPRFDAPPAGDIDSVEKLVSSASKWLADNPIQDDGWLVGWGYDHEVFSDGKHPSIADLDCISTEVPIVMMHASGHVGCCNSKVLDICGITKDSPDPEGGIYRRDAVTGELTGVVEERALTVSVLGHMPLPTTEFYINGIERAEKMYLSHGVTTAQDGGTDLKTTPLVNMMHQLGQSKIDLYVYPQIGDVIDQPELVPESKMAAYHDGVKIAGVKLFLDGSPQAKTAWLSQPYFIPPEGTDDTYCGYPVIPDDDVACNYFKTCLQNKWQILVHCNGDAAIEQFITQYARAKSETGITDDLRPVVVHCQTVREDQLDRMKELGLLPTFFHDHVYLWGDLHLDSVLGPERGSRISPLTSALKRGINFTIHQDTPVVEPNMILSMHHAVNRKTRNGRDIGPEFCVSPLEALKAVTINAAYQIFEEHSKGSIEEGKQADLVILDKSPLEVPKEIIKDIRVLETIKNGEVVYRAD